VDEVGEGVEVIVLWEESQGRSIHGSRRVTEPFVVGVWVDCSKEGDFVKG